MTADILFINGIPFFISLSPNITFNVVSHLEYRKSTTTFKSFKEIYMYYLKRGFQITTLHVDGEIAPLQELIQEIPGGLSSENDPEIERRIQV